MPPEFTAALGGLFIINILGWLTPGPNMLVIISAATNRGRKAGFVTGLGVGFGGVVWASLAVSGVVVLFEVFPKMIFALRMLGAGYLVWLGYNSLRAAHKNSPTVPLQNQGTKTSRAAFQTGFLVMITNPKAVIYFGSILTAFAPENAPLWMLLAIVIITTVQSILQHFITASIFSAARVSVWFQNTKQGMQRLFGTLYIALGLGVAYDAIRRL